MKDKIHFHTLLCNPPFSNCGDTITASKSIEEVTCPKCMYFYFHPEAKVLEDAYKAGRL